jgi:hypothetical protein
LRAFPVKENLEPEALDGTSLKRGTKHGSMKKKLILKSKAKVLHELNRVPLRSFEGVASQGGPGTEAIDEASLKVGQNVEISKETDSHKS